MVDWEPILVNLNFDENIVQRIVYACKYRYRHACKRGRAIDSGSKEAHLLLAKGGGLFREG